MGLAAYAQDAAQQVANLAQFKAAESVVAYTPLRDEIPFIEPLRAQFPDKHWHIIPLDGNCTRTVLAQTDAILVPARALDAAGNRLGRGGGFYDRLLANFTGTSISIVPDFAFLECMPTEPHDQSVDIALKARKMAPLD